MKKRLAVCLMIVVVGAFAVVALSQTTSDLEWDVYGGVINHTFVAGDDATVSLGTGGAHAWGSLLDTDAENNPYSYGVDTVSTQVRANVTGGGGISFRMDRQDSWTPMYGGAGQYTATALSTSDGNAALAVKSRTNYAGMVMANYSWQNSDQYTADGSTYQIDHQVWSASGSEAFVHVLGSGSGALTLMTDTTNAGGWRFGEGAGCYTNAKFVGTGSGTFQLGAEAPNNIATGWGWTVPGGSLSATVNYSNGFDVDGINMNGH